MEWLTAVRVRSRAHDRAVEHYACLNRILGIPTIIVTAVVGTTIFSSLSATPTAVERSVVGSLSILAAILTSLQTFLGYSAVAEKHKTAADRYSDLRRQIEEVLSRNATARDPTCLLLQSERSGLL